jgi:hypothetical protein
VAEKLIVSGALYQPFVFGTRDGVAPDAGPVASYLIATDPEPRFPALSRHPPPIETDGVSGPE